MLGIGLLAVILLSIDELPTQAKHGAAAGHPGGSPSIFLVEYMVRLMGGAGDSALRRHLSAPWPACAGRCPCNGLIGLLAIMPAVMLAGGYSITGA